MELIDCKKMKGECCRICHSLGETNLKKILHTENEFQCEILPALELISPCECKGTMKWVHRSCLNAWRYSYLMRQLGSRIETFPRHGISIRFEMLNQIHRYANIWKRQNEVDVSPRSDSEYHDECENDYDISWWSFENREQSPVLIRFLSRILGLGNVEYVDIDSLLYIGCMLDSGELDRIHEPQQESIISRNNSSRTTNHCSFLYCELCHASYKYQISFDASPQDKQSIEKKDSNIKVNQHILLLTTIFRIFTDFLISLMYGLKTRYFLSIILTIGFIICFGHAMDYICIDNITKYLFDELNHQSHSWTYLSRQIQMLIYELEAFVQECAVFPFKQGSWSFKNILQLFVVKISGMTLTDTVMTTVMSCYGMFFEFFLRASAMWCHFVLLFMSCLICAIMYMTCHLLSILNWISPSSASLFLSMFIIGMIYYSTAASNSSIETVNLFLFVSCCASIVIDTNYICYSLFAFMFFVCFVNIVTITSKYLYHLCLIIEKCKHSVKFDKRWAARFNKEQAIYYWNLINK